jgi:hypothetical protein
MRGDVRGAAEDISGRILRCLLSGAEDMQFMLRHQQYDVPLFSYPVAIAAVFRINAFLSGIVYRPDHRRGTNDLIISRFIKLTEML